MRFVFELGYCDVTVGHILKKVIEHLYGGHFNPYEHEFLEQNLKSTLKLASIFQIT